MSLFTKEREKHPDRRAGNVPHVGNVPRARTQLGAWRRKRDDAGKKERNEKTLWDYIKEFILKIFNKRL
ncbi:hypothetical protein CL617_02995 [archaeon]|nr:hypothetical protein [archaeon]|tara:strand:+ start:11971 stop:12177 length:207 start_codon:yes stop_codon:yes gene_type:complete